MTIKKILSKKIIYVLGAIIVLYTLIGFFLLPILGKNILTDQLSKSLNREVTIEKIAANPYALTATIDALVVKDKNKDVFLSAQKIFANLSLSSLFTLTLVVSDISLESPYVNIIRNEDDSYNFSELLNSGKSSEASSEKENDPKGIMGFILKNVNITGGEIAFTDKATKVSHLVKDFSLFLPFLSSKRKNRYEKASMDIGFVLNQVKFDIHVESTPFAEDLATQTDIKTSDIDVIHYLSYLPIPETILLKNGDLNLNLHANYQKKNLNNSLLLQGKLNILNVDVKSSLEEDIIKFPAVSVDILKSDILANQLSISKILIQTPELNVSRDKDGKINLLKYIPQNTKNHENEAANKDADTHKKPFVFNLADFEIKEAAIFFQDLSNEKEFKSKIFPLNAQIVNLEVKNTVSGEYRLNLVTETKETIDSNGRFQTNPVQVDGTLGLSHLIFNKYAPYYESLVSLDVKEGSMSFESDFQISQKQDKFDVIIKTREFLIQTLSIFDQHLNEEMINLPEFKITGALIDIGNKKIDTGTITAQNGKILVKRLKDGQMNLIKSVLPVPEIKNPAKPTIEKDTGLSEAANVLPWAVTLNSFDATGFNVVFNDLTPTDPVTLDLSNIVIKAADLKNFGEEKGSVSANMNWGGNGRISIKGEVVPSILSAGLDIDLEKIDIKSLQPYFTDAVRILVTDGNINIKGRLNLDRGDKSEKNIRFAGETSITNFISLDKQTAKDFFKCNSLYLSGLDVSVFPFNVMIKDISLTDFYSRMVVSDTGEINLNSIFKMDTTKDSGGEPENKPDKTESEIQQIAIESVTLQGGNISFSDYLTQPNFTANMKQIAGSVTGLSSEAQSRAKLHLQGIHGLSSPLDIIGTINPLAQKKFADIHISFKDIELTNFTPYSSKYLGYKIEKGKLILDLAYRIDGNKLESENKVRFDNFELGERVDSKQATSLPIGLAVSLLKNRDGQIDLDLPVSGDLDDPEFKIGPIIFKMMANLVLKVVTSPFSIIGSMFGGGEELSYVEFGYGEAKIADSNYEKIDKLVQILQEKPSIKLEIQGIHDTLRDAESLRMKGFEELIKTTKLKEMMASGSSTATLEDVVVEDKDLEYYIDTAYADAEFPKPRDEAGIEKKLDMEEKKKLLITTINIGEDDLRLLSMNRSEMIKAYLMSTGKVEKERIFLLEPAEQEGSDTERTSRVKFSLK